MHTKESKLLPYASAVGQICTFQIISLMCACLPLCSSHQPAEVSVVKWDHSAGQAQHFLSGLTGEKHTHTKHAPSTLTEQSTVEISFKGMCLLPDAVSVVRLVAQLCMWLKSQTLVLTPFISLSEKTKEPKQAEHAGMDALSIWFPFRKSIFGLLLFSHISCWFLFIWEWMCRSTNVWLLIQVVNLFNMFITYGDTFLPTSNSYDELYYEIVRMHQVFDNLYCMGMLLKTEVLKLNIPVAITLKNKISISCF